MRILAWNIRQGGGSRLVGIAAALQVQNADVLVLSEYRGGEAGLRLRAMLAGIGFPWASRSEPPPGRNGVLIAARQAFRDRGVVDATLPEPWKIVDAVFPGFRLTGVYMPNLRAKEPYWDRLIATLPDRARASALVIGDFNTCRPFVDEPGAFDVTAHYLDKIEAIGFSDLWRKRFPEGREYSWYSHRHNGFRIDHAFFSRRLAKRTGEIRYSHTEREARLSDHSPLVLELSP
jgi:exodeoxyribonuclease III